MTTATTTITTTAATTVAPAAPAVPSVHRRALLTWVAVYSMITLVQSLVGPVVSGLPLPLRTLVFTVIVVPVVVYLVVPNLLRLNARLSRKR
ncbi:hypothetical protein F0L68_35365 [Solihabitans fulvus]|uniref:Uncharacterized protein n=1 Tax=Solihabitans fulvus TaxID=1892852 RepID=A0A5B2WP42_9PSEU|nr:hypothetical protein [Solihabitans fulvus]KAA2252590.1 hypothetical protein F0L68_35365 [Solihabitans fulvus]